MRTWRSDVAGPEASMLGDWVTGSRLVCEEPGASGLRGITWEAGEKPKLFLLNWIMKPSSNCPEALWNCSSYTANPNNSTLSLESCALLPPP